ncbi:MAG: YigZ family protein [Oscillospiraceae bacterium]|jgi:uncharacterized YigZ family protein|nr:YigZ family protein [Oscillospiraceae bacterium]
MSLFQKAFTIGGALLSTFGGDIISEYKTVQGESYSEFTEKKSKFISNCANVNSQEQALQYITKVKSKYHGAKHSVYAYCIHNSKILKYSDDAEPHGTAGLQLLTVIKNFELENAVIVVTRYFGGILLGVGGLSRAYRKSAEDCIKNSHIVTEKLCLVIKFTISYAYIRQVSSILNSNVSLIKKIDYGELIEVAAYVEKENFNLINEKLSKCLGGKINLSVLEEKYHSLE